MKLAAILIGHPEVFTWREHGEAIVEVILEQATLGHFVQSELEQAGYELYELDYDEPSDTVKKFFRMKGHDFGNVEFITDRFLRRSA